MMSKSIESKDKVFTIVESGTNAAITFLLLLIAKVWAPNSFNYVTEVVVTQAMAETFVVFLFIKGKSRLALDVVLVIISVLLVFALQVILKYLGFINYIMTTEILLMVFLALIRKFFLTSFRFKMMLLFLFLNIARLSYILSYNSFEVELLHILLYSITAYYVLKSGLKLKYNFHINFGDRSKEITSGLLQLLNGKSLYLLSNHLISTQFASQVMLMRSAVNIGNTIFEFVPNYILNTGNNISGNFKKKIYITSILTNLLLFFALSYIYRERLFILVVFILSNIFMVLRRNKEVYILKEHKSITMVLINSISLSIAYLVGFLSSIKNNDTIALVVLIPSLVILLWPNKK